MTRVQFDSALTEDGHSASGAEEPDGSRAVAQLYGQRLTALFWDVVESIGSSGLECDEDQLRRIPERHTVVIGRNQDTVVTCYRFHGERKRLQIDLVSAHRREGRQERIVIRDASTELLQEWMISAADSMK
jgi:hypothetical protein